MARVMIVEDERLVAMDMISTLKAKGHDVVGYASSGEEAIELAASTAPDLLLVDIRLNGDIDGIEAARRLKSTLGAPVVYVTAYAESAVLDRAIATNIQAYLVKPYDDSELAAAIDVALHNHAVSVAARQREVRLDAVLRNMRDAVVAVDSRWRITLLNEATSRLARCAGDEAEGHLVSEIIDIRMRQGDGANALKSLVETGKLDSIDHKAMLLPKGGAPVPIEWHITPLSAASADGDDGYLLTLRDVTEYRTRESELQQAAFYDPLTGAPNRRLFEQLLVHSINQIERRADYLFAVMFVDIDDFKAVNDQFGHDVGDQVLIGAAARLVNMSRPSDVVARLGGDEFVILLDNIARRSDAERIARRVVDVLRGPYFIDNKSTIASASVGVAVNSPRSSTESIMKRADQAMYEAKRSGKSRCVVAGV